MESEPGIAAAPLGQDEHYGPVRTAEYASKRLFVGRTGERRVSGMGVDPRAGELLGATACIDLLVEELGDRRIVELDRDRRAALPHEPDIFDQEQIVGRTDPEPAHFRVTLIPQIQEFGPRRGAEAEYRTAPLLWRMPEQPPGDWLGLVIPVLLLQAVGRFHGSLGTFHS